MKILEKEGKTFSSRQGRRIHSSYQGILNNRYNINDRSIRHFPSKSTPYPQNFCHELSLVSREIDYLDKIKNSQSSQNLRNITLINMLGSKPKSPDYIYVLVGSNNDLSVTVSLKGTETECECYQLVGSLHKTIYLLKVELKDKQATINNFADIIKNFTVNDTKKDGSHEQKVMKVLNKDNDDDIVREMLHIDQLHYQFQKLKDQPIQQIHLTFLLA